MPAEPIDKLLTRADLAARGINFSRSHLWALERKGQFPERIRLSPRIVRWRESEINHYVESRAAQRQGGAA